MSIESELKVLVDSFVGAVAGLFEITGQYVATFEQGVYSCIIAKPSRRLRAALAVDREVLVVCSNFKDQQQRSIKFLKREIDDSNGRFESTLAIFVHRDSEGNGKLKNWGRDQGVSILPLFQPEMTSDPTDLERALCGELYSHDPFDVTGPVSDDANFFGRRDEAIDLARKLQKNQIRSCLGIRKIGKTSIINRVVQEVMNNHNCICIMVDCSRDDVWSSNAASLMNAIGESIEKSRVDGLRYAAIRMVEFSGGIVRARENLEASVLRSELPVIVIFDEIDYVTPGSPTAPHWKAEFNSFWRNFRAAYQEISRQTRNISLLIGGVSTYWFTVESIDGVENAALSFVPEEYLSPMQEGATVAMIKRLSKSAGLRLDDKSYELIARTSGNMPFWARKCCSWINDKIPVSDRPLDVDINMITPLIDAFAREEGATIAGVALRHLFRVHPGVEEAAFSCAEGKSAGVDKNMLRVLNKYGVTDKNNEVSAAMLAHGLSTIDRKSTNEKAIEAVDVGFLNEWAEDLAAISKRRNILERKLRDLVLNWIRLDSASNQGRPSTKDRIMAVVPAAQKSSFVNTPSDALIEKLLWTQLVQIIEREWAIFAKVFGDKKKFHEDCSLINDRFDAHAKSADRADFALYRRALTHLEEKINRL